MNLSLAIILYVVITHHFSSHLLEVSHIPISVIFAPTPIASVFPTVQIPSPHSYSQRNQLSLSLYSQYPCYLSCRPSLSHSVIYSLSRSPITHSMPPHTYNVEALQMSVLSDVDLLFYEHEKDEDIVHMLKTGKIENPVKMTPAEIDELLADDKVRSKLIVHRENLLKMSPAEIGELPADEKAKGEEKDEKVRSADLRSQLIVHRKLFLLQADNNEEKKKKKKREGKNTKDGKKRDNAEKTKQLVDLVIKKKKKPKVDPPHLLPFIRRSILDRPSPSLPSSNDETWPGNRPIKRNPKREIEPADITITLHQNAKTETPRQHKGCETLSVEEIQALRLVLTESVMLKEEMRDLHQTVSDLRQEIKEMKEKMVLPARAIAATRKDVKKMCAYCTKRSHFGIDCKTYTSSEKRIKVLTRYGRCLGCFRKSCKNLACGTRCNKCGLQGFNQAHCPGEH